MIKMKTINVLLDRAMITAITNVRESCSEAELDMRIGE